MGQFYCNIELVFTKPQPTLLENFQWQRLTVFKEWYGRVWKMLCSTVEGQALRTTQLSNTGLRRQSNKQRHKKYCVVALSWHDLPWWSISIRIELDWIEEYQCVDPPRLWGGSFRRGLNSELVTFSTARAVQPSLLYKSNGWKSKMAASHFCILPPDWPGPLFYSGPALC